MRADPEVSEAPAGFGSGAGATPAEECTCLWMGGQKEADAPLILQPCGRLDLSPVTHDKPLSSITGKITFCFKLLSLWHYVIASTGN